MIEPQPQYYDPTAPVAPPPEPWWKKKAVFAGGVGLGALLIVGVASWYAYQWYTLRQESAGVRDVERRVEESVQSCEDADDVERCRANVRSDIAQSAGEAEACRGLEDKKLKNCVTLIALETVDAESCEVLAGNDRTGCIDAVLLVKAQRDENAQLCGEIQDDALQTACSAQFRDFSSIDDALASGNPQDCAALSTDDRVVCEDMYTSIDADADGLNRLREYQIGTSDDNADTDGDGYNDGQEVASGYDPLK